MTLPETAHIWHNGEFVPWDEARIHVLSHVVHYASSVFEGIRCYRTQAGPAVFRLADHMRRLIHSARIYRMDVPYSQQDLAAAAVETIRINGMDECYIRPVILRGYDSMGVDPTPCPLECFIAVWPWGAYLGAEAIESGVEVKVSTWNRPAQNTLPTHAKAAANYMNAQLIKMEALADGYAEAIALDSLGYVSEGSGENVFLVDDGVVITPSLASSVLPGITRDSVIRLARDLGYAVEERRIARGCLYTADEIFFTGTAAEITPIRSVDRIPVGNGRRGPVTERLQQAFFGLLRGEAADRYDWLTPVPPAVRQSSGA
ncbi:MAG: branched-chain amino acid transaminase [Acidobacteriota bacterium]